MPKNKEKEMPKILAYNIVGGANVVILEQRVNALIETGWRPLGGLAVVLTDAQKCLYFYLQPMAHYES